MFCVLHQTPNYGLEFIYIIIHMYSSQIGQRMFLNSDAADIFLMSILGVSLILRELSFLGENPSILVIGKQ